MIFLLNRRSRFVSFHALQALLWQIFVLIVWVGVMLAWIGVFFGLMFAHGTPAPNQPPPMAIFILMPLMWLSIMAVGGLTLVLSIVYAIKAGRGEWVNYPLLGRLARRMLGI